MAEPSSQRPVSITAVLACVLWLAGGGAAGAADTQPATKAAEPAGKSSASDKKADAAATKAAIQAAVTELSKEFQAAIKDPTAEGPIGRSESNYFDEKPSNAITNEAILDALLSRSYGGDPVSAYVKWQLLSGLKEGTDEEETRELTAGLVRAYRTAPRPLPRPGIGRDQQQQLDRALRGREQAEEGALRAQLEQEVARVARLNQPILAYRDELFRRLPSSYEAYAAGFEDAVARLQAGAEVREHLQLLSSGVRTWAATGAPPQQVAAMAQAITKLKTRRGPEYYSDIDWKANERRLEWRRTSRGLNDDKGLDDLAEYLQELAANPDGGLKFRNED